MIEFTSNYFIMQTETNDDFFIECTEIEPTNVINNEFNFNLDRTKIHQDKRIGRLANELTFKNFYLSVSHNISTMINLLGFKMINFVTISIGQEQICKYTGKDLEELSDYEKNKYGFRRMLEGTEKIYVPLRILNNKVVDKLTYKVCESNVSLEEFLSKIVVSFKFNEDYLPNIKKVTLIVDMLIR